MRRIVFMIIVGIICILSSCASMDNTNYDNSLMILLNENETTSRSDAFVYYRFRGPNITLKINVMEKYQRFNYLKPSQYKITNFEAMYIKDGSIAQTYPILSEFELLKDSVYIFPYKTVTTMKGKTQLIGLVKLTESDYKKCEEYISSQERYNNLRIVR